MTTKKTFFHEYEGDTEVGDLSGLELEGFFEESLDEFKEEEIINSFPKLDTFSEIKKNDGTYSYDEEYFDGE